MGATKRKNPNYYKPNFWGAMRDVLIASMNKGQFPMALLSFILLAIILKMPATEVGTLAFKIIGLMQSFSILGWILTFVFAFMWYKSSKNLRKGFSEEFFRVGKEKKDLQEKLTLRKLDSSNDK